MKTILAALFAMTCVSYAQTYRTVTADTNNVIRTNFTMSLSQVGPIAISNITGLQTALDGKLGTNATTALEQINLVNSNGSVYSLVTTNFNFAAVRIATTNTGTGIAIGSGATTPNQGNVSPIAIGHLAQVSSNSGVAIGNQASVFVTGGIGDGVAIGPFSTSRDGGAVGRSADTYDGGAVGRQAFSTDGAAIGRSAYSDNGGAMGQYASAIHGFAGGQEAVADATNSIQIGKGTNSIDYTMQLFSAGSVNTNEWAALASSTAIGREIMQAPTNGSNGQALIWTNNDVAWGTVAAGGGSGSVTNVDASGGSTGLTFTGGPITNGGTLTLGGTLSLASGGTGATNASGARTALELGSAATNNASAFQPASSALTNLANNNGGALTNLSAANFLPSYSGNDGKVLAVATGGTNIEWTAISNTVTDASLLTNFPAIILQTNSADASFPAFLLRTNGSAAGLTSFPASLLTTNGDASGLTNFPTLNQNTTGTASNVTGVVAIANGGSGQTTAAAAIEAFLPSYAGNADRFLALNSNATGLVWTTNAGGGSGTVTSVAMTVPSFLSVSGSPITSSGTLAVTLSGTALPVANGGSGATTASNARINLLPNYSNNATKVLALNSNATDVEWITQSGGTSGVASVDVSGGTTGLTTSGGPITNSGTITLGGTLSIAAGGTGQTNAASAIEALLPAYTNNATRVLALNSNATALEWVVNGTNGGGGSGTVTSVDASGGSTGMSFTGGPITTNGTITLGGTLGVGSGGTGGTNAATALHNLGIVQTNATQSIVVLGRNALHGDNINDLNVAIGDNARIGNNGGSGGSGIIVIGVNATNTGDNSGGIAIGESASSGASGVAFGRDTFAQNSISIGAGSRTTNSANGIAIGMSANATNSASSVALGTAAVNSGATNSVQLSTGTNTSPNTIQFLNAGTVNATEWGYLANASAAGGSRMTNTNGVTATNTIIGYDGTNYTTNTITVIDGIITSWTQ